MTKELSDYRMPAEWEKHSATQLHWPANRETWPGERLGRVERVYVDVIEALSKYEPVLLLADPSVRADHINKQLRDSDTNLSNVYIHSVAVNDVWARDCGPIFVRKRTESNAALPEFAITDWEYNAWGGKYPPFDDDNLLPAWIAEKFGIHRYPAGMVLEGGSIETNGEGVLLTTESVLLNENRNPGLRKQDIEKRLKAYLGIEKIIWLKDGLKGDDTDGHIDDLSRFLNNNTILTMVSDDVEDVNYKALSENLKALENSRNLTGDSFHIVTLTLPKTKIEGTTVDGSEYVPASYANFYIANECVLVPLYDERHDEDALGLFKEYFPDRDIIGIECSDLVWGQGSIHCITQQLYGLSL